MKLNARVIYNRLKKAALVKNAKYSHNFFVERPVFYETDSYIKNRAIIVNGEDFRECVGKVTKCVVLCVGGGEDMDVITNNDMIWLKEGISEKKILNIMTDIYDLFEKWDWEMQRVLNENMGYKELINTCNMVFMNPMVLMDRDFNYIAYANDTRIYERVVDEMEQLPLEDVNDLTSMPGFKELEKEKDAFLIVTGEAAICKNIFYNDTYVGRLLLLLEEDENEDVIEYEKSLIGYLAVYVEKMYKQCNGFELVPQKREELHKVLQNSLESGIVEEGKLQKILWENDNKPGDIYYMLVIRENHLQKGKVYNLKYLSAQIERMWAGAYSVVCKKDIAVLFDQNVFRKSRNMEFHKEMVYFLRESVLVSGCSREFTDLSMLCDAFFQAKFAIDLGFRKNYTYCYHQFDDYGLDFILQNGTKSYLPSQICSKKMLNLYRYDQENETSYYKTLVTYMRMQYNAVASAKELYIHRSSFINRMDRIRELTDLRLDDPDERLYLLLSYKIMNEYSQDVEE